MFVDVPSGANRPSEGVAHALDTHTRHSHSAHTHSTQCFASSPSPTRDTITGLHNVLLTNRTAADTAGDADSGGHPGGDDADSVRRYFVMSVEPEDGTLHGKLGQKKHGYFEVHTTHGTVGDSEQHEIWTAGGNSFSAVIL